MLTDLDRQRLAEQRRAYADWQAGDHREPFELAKQPGYGICEVLFPTRRSDVIFHLRYAAMALIGKLPWSWPKVRLYRCMGVRIGRGVYIAPGVLLDWFNPSLIELGDGCFLGMGCRLMAHEMTPRSFRIGAIRIGPGAVVGGWAIVRGGVTVGANAMVAAASAVGKDVPESATAVGVQARVIRPGTRSE